ncbi:MmcQ/YjbR family DNA-binding protein [Ruania alba]|uniref:YjbR protein n=1 Tax=Ruania alba TaxID=648782 RepID=A0A1H5L7E0_9MICO|nr:MmcQ/YjbR family DNA-binding protein [Ruania alba]SEE72477.1 YjbR protein [Ruania alba]
MIHPRMFDDGDPYLARVRHLCLAFPQAQEKESHGRPTFRATKVFTVYGGGTKGNARERIMYDHSLLLLPDDAERLALEQDPRSFVPAYYGPAGWIGWDLAHDGTAAEEVDWPEVFELVEASYRALATPTLRRLLDESDLTPEAFR